MSSRTHTATLVRVQGKKPINQLGDRLRVARIAHPSCPRTRHLAPGRVTADDYWRSRGEGLEHNMAKIFPEGGKNKQVESLKEGYDLIGRITPA